MNTALHERQKPVISPADGKRRVPGVTRAATPILRAIGLVKTPIDIATLERQRETLNARFLTATAQADEARTRRRECLLADPIDEAAVAEAEAMMRVATDRLGGVQEAVAALVERIEAARAAEAAELDAAKRERVATEIEARAERVTKAAVELDRKAEAFNTARLAVIEAAGEIVGPPDFAGFHPSQLAQGAMIAGAAHLSGIAPRGDGSRMMGASESAVGGMWQHVETMKRQAAAIRSGEAPPVLQSAPPPYVRPAPVSTTRVVLSRPVSYHLAGHGFVQTLSGDIELPEVIAKVAKEIGIGFDPSSSDGKAITGALLRMGGHAPILKRADRGVWVPDKGEPSREGGPPVAPDQYLDLGVLSP